MSYDIIIGRNKGDRERLGKTGTLYLGKGYVKMGQTTSLSNNILLDVSKSHVILLSGKRGSGKSFSLGVIAEEIANLPKEVSENLSVLIFDTMGIFWTMKYENVKEYDLLIDWGLKPKSLADKINIFVPGDKFNEYKAQGIPADKKFYLRPSELDASDWGLTFGVKLTDPLGILIEKIIFDLDGNYSIKDIINKIKKEKDFNRDVINSAVNRFISANSWGVFSVKGTKLKDLIDRGNVSILDLSVYSHMAGNWGIKNLVIGILSKKLLQERIESRRIEELESIKYGKSYIGIDFDLESKEKMPLVWLLLDEIHEFLPKDEKTASSDALSLLLKEGRQPGISMVMATQQPGELHHDALTQSDIVISHRVTARKDVTALNDIMQTYLSGDIQKYLNELPRLKGSAIILDDNSERIYPMRVRPRFTWHGGEAPVAVKSKKRELLELGI